MNSKKLGSKKYCFS